MFSTKFLSAITLAELPGNVGSESLGVLWRIATFGAPDVFIAEGDGAEAQQAVGNVAVSRNGAEAPATHAMEKSALGGDAMESVRVIEAADDFIRLSIADAAFETEGGLADAREH